MGNAAIVESKKIDNVIRNFTVTPFPKVSERLARATKDTIEALDKKTESEKKDSIKKYE